MVRFHRRMANKPCLRWTPTSWILLFVSGFVMGQQTDLKCNYTSDTEYVGNGMFDVYTFEVEEGILLEPGKIIGTITLPVDNFTNSFGYDEPYFSKPYNKKSSPLPKYFDIKFTNITTLQNSTSTTTKPRIKRDVATVRPISEHMSTLGSLDYYQNLTFYTNTTLRYNSGAMKHIGVTLKPTTASSLTTESVTNIELGSLVSTSTSNGGTSLPNLTSAPLNSTSHISASTSQTTTTPATTSDTTTSGFVTNVTSLPVTSNMTSAITTASTPASPTECVVAQILQIFDLDREKQDTHHLTINENIGEMGLPTIVKLKVTDVNDNSPIFVNESLSSRITKDIQYGQVVAEIKATDADIGKNADLRYDIQSYSERRGNEKASPDFPTFLIHGTSGLVILFGSLDDLKPPTQITFSVVVKDRGDELVGNRATASATVSIIDDSWKPDPIEPSQVSGGVIAGCVMGGVVFLGICIFLVVHCARKRFIRQNNGQLEFMLDDENLISA